MERTFLEPRENFMFNMKNLSGIVNNPKVIINEPIPFQIQFFNEIEECYLYIKSETKTIYLVRTDCNGNFTPVIDDCVINYNKLLEYHYEWVKVNKTGICADNNLYIEFFEDVGILKENPIIAKNAEKTMENGEFLFEIVTKNWLINNRMAFSGICSFSVNEDLQEVEILNTIETINLKFHYNKIDNVLVYFGTSYIYSDNDENKLVIYPDFSKRHNTCLNCNKHKRRDYSFSCNVPDCGLDNRFAKFEEKI